MRRADAAAQTGNLTQLMISSVALLFLRVRPSTSASSEESSMHSSRVILSAGSVVGFALGAFLSQQAVLRFGAAQRARLAGTHLVGALIVLAVASVIARGYDLHSDVAPYLIGALACTMGAQAVVGQRSGNAPYATTVVFTGERGLRRCICSSSLLSLQRPSRRSLPIRSSRTSAHRAVGVSLRSWRCCLAPARRSACWNC